MVPSTEWKRGLGSVEKKIWYWLHKTELNRTKRSHFLFLFLSKRFVFNYVPFDFHPVFSVRLFTFQGNIFHISFTAFSNSLPSACSTLSVSELFPLYPDEGGSTFLQNVCIYLPNYTTSRTAVYNFCVIFFFCLTDICGPNVPPDTWPALRRTPRVGDV